MPASARCRPGTGPVPAHTGMFAGSARGCLNTLSPYVFEQRQHFRVMSTGWLRYRLSWKQHIHGSYRELSIKFNNVSMILPYHNFTRLEYRRDQIFLCFIWLSISSPISNQWFFKSRVKFNDFLRTYEPWLFLPEGQVPTIPTSYYCVCIARQYFTGIMEILYPSISIIPVEPFRQNCNPL